jgi:hypothetical protein
MKLRLTCREVTHKLLLRAEQPWAWHDHLLLRLHWAVCRSCRHFKGQAHTMGQAMQAWRRYRETDTDEGA